MFSLIFAKGRICAAKGGTKAGVVLVAATRTNRIAPTTDDTSAELAFRARAPSNHEGWVGALEKR